MISEELGIIKRYAGNPILSAKDSPYPATLIFNAGIAKFQGKYVMCFRNDYNFTQSGMDADLLAEWAKIKTNIGLATSDDGIHWEIEPEPVFEMHGNGIRRAYDPRLTVIDGRCYLCFACDTDAGICGGIAVTDDLHHFQVLFQAEPDNRNMVLFPEKIGGHYIRLDRPMPVYSKVNKESFDLWLSRSPDLAFWGMHKRLLTYTDVPELSNSKVGPGAPPIKTAKGWLTTFHSVWKDESRDLYAWGKGVKWNKLYFSGLMLLDLEDPTKVLGIAKKPLIYPVEKYEIEGFRGSVIFPGGMILEPSGEVKIYYGACDTVECLATANVDDLIKACLE